MTRFCSDDEPVSRLVCPRPSGGDELGPCATCVWGPCVDGPEARGRALIDQAVALLEEAAMWGPYSEEVIQAAEEVVRRLVALCREQWGVPPSPGDGDMDVAEEPRAPAGDDE